MASADLDHIAEEVVYTALGHQDIETSRIPLSPNSLSFTNREIDEKYNARLIGEGEMSITFRNNLILFSSSLIVFCVVSIVAFAVEYFRNSNIAQKDLLVHLICLMLLLVSGIALMFGVRLSNNVRVLMKKLYLLYMFLMVIYLILCDQRVLSSLTSTPYSPNHCNYTMVLLLFLYLYHLISFAYFLGMFILSLITMGMYLVLLLCFSPQDQVVTVADFLYLTVFCVLLCFHTHQTEFRARNLFYRMIREEEGSADNQKGGVKLDPKSQKGIGTEGEKLIDMCESIRAKVKAAASVIILTDIKSGLKDALLQLEKIKQRVARGNLNEIDRLEMQESMDEEDIEFLKQQIYQKDVEGINVCPVPTLKMQNRRGSIVSIAELGLGMEVLSETLSTIGTDWSFDIWQAHSVTNHSIFIVGKYLMKKWELSAVLMAPEEISDQFFLKVERMYVGNPYHNACHGADVCHTMMYFLETSGIIKKLTSLELTACIISSLGHDIGHPGFTNRFLVNNREKLAMRYNDSSVLESMHAARLYKIMLEPERNILISVSSEDWVSVRKLVISLVLHTDMSRHFEMLGMFRTRAQSALGMENAEEKTFILSMALKCSDVGHAAKPQELHLKWSSLITEEFFHQGDVEKERGLPVSMYCDRDKTDIAKSQSGFLKNICVPLFEAWTGFLESPEINEKCMDQILDNLIMWEGKTKAKKASMLLLANTLGGRDLGLGSMAGEVKHGLDLVAKSD